jgi:hypothetical protein
MTRLENIAGPSLYGLLPLTDDQAIQTGVPPMPVTVFQCHSCGVLALFRWDSAETNEDAARAVAEEVNTGLMERQIESIRQVEDFLDAPGE